MNFVTAGYRYRSLKLTAIILEDSQVRNDTEPDKKSFNTYNFISRGLPDIKQVFYFNILFQVHINTNWCLFQAVHILTTVDKT